MNLKKKNTHPRDKRIKQHKDFETNHIYLIDEKENNGYISVTSFIHNFFPNFDADKIININYNRWQKDPTNKYYNLKPIDIKKNWQNNAKAQSDLGTQLHNDIEDYYNINKKSSNLKREWAQFVSFINNHSELKPYRTEFMVFDEDIRLCGTIDMLYKKGNKYIIVDWKRTKEIKKKNIYERGLYPISYLSNTNYWKYALQLNMYKYILETKYNIEIEEMFLIQMHPSLDDYNKIIIPNMQKDIKLLLKQ